MIKVFGHKSPDTDSTGSPIIWAWYLTEMQDRDGGRRQLAFLHSTWKRRVLDSAKLPSG